jgi:MerR family transcriptional regulator/heat shock protein HspR
MKRAAEVRRAAPVLMEAHGNPGACFPIGVVADLLGVTEQTLRLYESHGLVKPARRNRERYYCAGDVQWLECLRRLIHTEKVSIEGVKRLLRFAPCWEIIGLPQELQCSACPVFRERSAGPAGNGDSRWAASAE